MSDLKEMPEALLTRAAQNSDKAVFEWRERVRLAEAKVERCRAILGSHIEERDALLAEMFAREIAGMESNTGTQGEQPRDS